MPTLLIVGDGAERTVDLTGRDLKIGRAPENDLVLPDPAKGVSRMHAELRYENGQYVIVDLNSQNGTWVGGHRIQRAQIAANAEIEIGPYRLTMRDTTPVPSPVETQIVGLDAPEPEMPTPMATLVTEAVSAPVPSVLLPPRPMAEAKPRPAPESRALSKPGQAAARSHLAKPMLLGALLVVAAIAIVLRVRFISQPPPRPPLVTEAATGSSRPSSAATPPPADTGSTVSAPVVQASDPPTSGQSPVAPPAQVPPSPAPLTRSTAPRQGSGTPARGRASAPTGTNVAGGGRNPAPSAARRPGESVQAWRSRVAPLQTKYASAKAALERGEFATALAGFDAILKDEPGYLDAPQLLARAREGQHASARDAFEAGNKLDAAGDWGAALQKYDLARQIDHSLAGLDDAATRVRERMHAAGVDAFKRARQYDALGRSAEALKEYEKAAQWLPSEDLNRKAARDRADQLKAGPK